MWSIRISYCSYLCAYASMRSLGPMHFFWQHMGRHLRRANLVFRFVQQFVCTCWLEGIEIEKFIRSFYSLLDASMLETRNSWGLSSNLKSVSRPRSREPKPPKLEKKVIIEFSCLVISYIVSLISKVIAIWNFLLYGRMRHQLASYVLKIYSLVSESPNPSRCKLCFTYVNVIIFGWSCLTKLEIGW